MQMTPPLYNCGNTFLEVISDLETTIDNLFDWFCCNNFKVNPSKCHLFLSPFNSLHEKGLRLTYQNRNSSFDELLKLYKSVSLHCRNLTVWNGTVSTVFLNHILTLDQNASYILRSGVIVTRRNIRTNKFGFETISTIGAVLWRNLPKDTKNSDGLNIFKNELNSGPLMTAHVRSAEIS